MNKGQSDSKNEKQKIQVVNQKLKCYHCRKLGRVISDCWELKGSPTSDGKNPARFVSQWKNKRVTLIIEIIIKLLIGSVMKMINVMKVQIQV